MNDPLFPSHNSGPAAASHNANPAAELIRRKLDVIYQTEPAIKQELAETNAYGKRLSKHQKFMRDLAANGQSLPEIQTTWHNYYVSLPDREKQEVWQEFYALHAQNAPPRPFTDSAIKLPNSGSGVIVANHETEQKATNQRSVADIRKQLLRKVSRSNNSRLKARHHLQSLAFGLSLGVLTVIIVLFGFFNEVFIAPFIQPSRHSSSTPIIVTADSVVPSNTAEVIIPKINVEIPVDYSQTSTDENVIENALENGVVHYPDTVMPGQQGNAAFFGHSSNNIFNPGKYKFAFVLLHELVPGDTFYLTNQGKVYAYQVIARRIVPPNDVSVLSDTQGKTATATLITCDPPGTSINRLVVTGEQISPNPAGDSTPATPTQTATMPTVLASNGPSLWTRLWKSLL